MLAILLVALSVGLDNFAAAIGFGLSGTNNRLRLQVAGVFGLFEGGMPIIGLLVGHAVASDLGSRAHVIGGALLVLTGAYGLFMAIRDRRKEEKEEASVDTRGPALGHLLLAGAALSIDNLIVGFALGAYHVSIVLAAIVIAIVSVSLSLVGLELGARIGAHLGKYGEFLGAGVLVGVGLAIGFGVL